MVTETEGEVDGSEGKSFVWAIVGIGIAAFTLLGGALLCTDTFTSNFKDFSRLQSVDCTVRFASAEFFFLASACVEEQR